MTTSIRFHAYSETYAAAADDEEDYFAEPEGDDFGNLYGIRDARDFLYAAGGSHCCGIQSVQADCSDYRQARSITAYASMDYIEGTYENRTICFPDSLTASTRARICRAILN